MIHTHMSRYVFEKIIYLKQAKSKMSIPKFKTKTEKYAPNWGEYVSQWEFKTPLSTRYYLNAISLEIYTQLS
jgi:hypothetical protein